MTHFSFLLRLVLTALLCATIGYSANSPLPVDKSKNSLDIENITRLQWISPDGSQPISYDAWKAAHGIKGPFEVHSEGTVKSAVTDREVASFAIIVEVYLYPSIGSYLERYALDLAGEGYDVSTYYTSGGTPESMRSFLQALYAEGLDGCVLIGDLPVPWYEIEAESDQFPCDLYYMDMDGNFTDADGDGMFDGHNGDVGPEIYVGRLTTSPLTLGGATEAGLLKDYFNKDHRYRCGLMPTANRALAYIDDDWSGAGPEWSMDMGRSYSSRIQVYDDWVTWGPDYVDRLPQDFEFIQVCVHSWAGGHAFKNPLDEWSWIYVNQIKDIQPVAHFYNLFACSNARYVETDYCSGWYIFGDQHGLAALGSTKSGSMLNFGDFYEPFGQGKTIGQAFRDWFEAQAQDGFAEWEITWFYGMTLNGDPTLTVQSLPENDILQYDNGGASYMMALPHPDADYYNTRFTATEQCTLSTVLAVGSFPGTPMRMYIWDSDGTYPTAVIASIDIPDGNLGMIDVSDRNLVFAAGENFHIGFTCPETAPPDTVWLYMDDGLEFSEQRSGLFQDGQWKTLAQYYGATYNFIIHAEVRGEKRPAVTITSLTIPNGTAGDMYKEELHAGGGTPPYTWDMTAGAMPNGFTLDASSGEISGIATEAGLFHFTVRATDASAEPLADIQPLDIIVTITCGDANNDGLANVADAVYMINYVFKNGSAPAVFDAGDANADGDANVADAVYLINYVFKSGPAPVCP